MDGPEDMQDVQNCAVADANAAFCLDNLATGADDDEEPSTSDVAVATIADPTQAQQRMHVELTSNKWHGIKQTLEIVRNNYRTCILTADKDRLCIMAFDLKHVSPGFLLDIAATNLEPYHCASPISVTVSTQQISAMLRHVRKRETVMFFIDSTNQRCGLLSNCMSGHARKSEISVSVIQLTYYDRPVPISDHRAFYIPTTDFGRMLKEMRNVARVVTISSRPGEWIRFKIESSHSRSNDEWFGRINNLPPVYKRDYEVQQFVRIIKISSLNSTDIELTFATAGSTAEVNPILSMRIELPVLGSLMVYFCSSCDAADASAADASALQEPRAKKVRVVSGGQGR
jgi:hypothetical protein